MMLGNINLCIPIICIPTFFYSIMLPIPTPSIWLLDKRSLWPQGELLQQKKEGIMFLSSDV